MCRLVRNFIDSSLEFYFCKVQTKTNLLNGSSIFLTSDHIILFSKLTSATASNVETSGVFNKFDASKCIHVHCHRKNINTN